MSAFRVIISRITKVSNLRHFLYSLLLSQVLFTLLSTSSLDFNFRHWLFRNDNQTTDIVVVAIDNKSLKTIGPWPWDRSKIAQIVEKLGDQNPESIALDIIFQSKPNDIANLQLNKTLAENQVVVATKQNSDLKLDEVVTKNLAKGFSNVSLNAQGQVDTYEFQKNNQKSLVSETFKDKKLLPKTYLNINLNLPKTLEISTLLDSPDLLSSLEGKRIFMGGTADSLNDFYFLPKVGRVAGVYIQALAAQQVELENFYFRSQGSSYTDQLYLLLFAFTTSTSKGSNGPWLLGLYSLSFPFLAYLLSILGFFMNPSLIAAAFLSGLVSILLKAWENFTKEKRKILRSLSSHLSPAILERVLSHSEMINLGGQKYEITVIFTDIRGFTELAEKMDPEEIGDLLNQVLGLQADIVLKNGGVVDKFIGDSVMAWWGAPLPDPNHAEKALKASLEIMETMEKFNQKSFLKTKIDIGIGINSGYAVVGNYGSRDRFSYTAIGDTVNSASRIEGLNKNYNSAILFGQRVLDYLTKKQKSQFNFGKVDKVQLRGKKEFMDIYRLH